MPVSKFDFYSVSKQRKRLVSQNRERNVMSDTRMRTNKTAGSSLIK